MPRGRKPKPLHLRKIEGSFRPDRHNANPPKPKPVRPDAPDWLKGTARAKWDELCDLLQDMGILTLADHDIVLTYCMTYARIVDQEREGELSYTQFLHLGNRLRTLGAELGLSPAARQRITVAPKSSTDADDDLFDAPVGGNA